MATVGIIANPAAGKDIRRLVAHGRFIPNQEKVNILKRIFSGLEAAGVDRVVLMPDSAMLGRAAADGTKLGFDVYHLEMPVFNEEQDSSRAAALMVREGVDCIVTLGGDGTNRAVAKHCGQVPLVPVSTGTNNVFPQMVEGTVAGLAAGVVATAAVDVHKVTEATKRLEVHQDGSVRDIALVDIAVAKQRFVGARAIWDMESVHEIYLSQARPGSIGLSSIGALLAPPDTDEEAGVYVRLGPGGTTVHAPVAPGVVAPVPVQEWRRLPAGERTPIGLTPCTIALDGERTFALSRSQTACVSLSDAGPRVVRVESALREAARCGVFREDLAASDETD